jgi:hypothetical protein
MNSMRTLNALYFTCTHTTAHTPATNTPKPRATVTRTRHTPTLNWKIRRIVSTATMHAWMRSAVHFPDEWS